MTKLTSKIWEPIAKVANHCADLSLSYGHSEGRHWPLIIRMHFSHVTGAPPKDLLITFERPQELRWELEGPVCFLGQFELPKLESGLVAPVSIVQPSYSADKYKSFYSEEFLCHYLFTTLNHCAQVIAESNPKVEWKTVNDEG